MAAAVAACTTNSLNGPAEFRTFTFERQFGFVTPDADVEHLTIERQTDDRYLLRFTRLIPDPGGGCCTQSVASQPRFLTATEREAVLDAFGRVRWERKPDTETCPLWDPAYVDVFRWDGFTITTNLCEAPYLRHERAQALRDVLFGLTREPI